MRKPLSIAGAAIAALLLVVAIALLWPLPAMPRNGEEGNFLIRNVAVIDVETGTVWPGRDVVLRDGSIASIGPAEPADAKGSLSAIDGTGKYLIPGLWDMHTHSLKMSAQYMHPLFIANGVTGIRDMSGCMSEPDSFFACIDDRKAWNDALKDRSGLSPRYILQSSFQINDGKEVPDGFPEFFKARNAEEVRELVTFYREAGADFLKTYSNLSSVAYQALADEAREQGLMLAGHRPLSVSLEEALAAGQRSIEHPRIFLRECFAGAAAFRALPDPSAAYDADLQWRWIDEHEGERCADLIGSMAESDTWWTPTLQVLQMSALAGDEAFRSDPRLRYIPYLFRKFIWTPDADRAAAQPADASGRELYPTLYRMALGHVGQAHSAGVKILTGTDAGDTYVFPGFSVHDELVALVSAGLSPADALRSATLDAAIFAGMEEQFGSIAIGKAGDLVLLDANPLENVRHTQRIAGLFFNGQFFDRAALDELLMFAEQQAGSSRAALHLLWDGLNSPLMRVQAAD
jgi:imidazolonepropionase-like amidohydrolase